MATIRGLGFSDIDPQPGFTATKAENGGWTGNHKFAIRRTAWANASVRGQFAKGVAITSLDPGLASFWNFMTVSTVTVDSEEGDFTMVTVGITGAQGATYGEDEEPEESATTYRLSGQLQDAPFSMHPKWKALGASDTEGLGLLINGQAIYDPATRKVGQFDFDAGVFRAIKSGDTEVVISEGDAAEFATRINAGETTYLRPTFTWTESTQGNSGLSDAQLNKLGNTATPRGNPPTPSGGRDWMLTSAFQEETGGLYRADLEWTLSERGGHDAFLFSEGEE